MNTKRNNILTIILIILIIVIIGIIGYLGYELVDSVIAESKSEEITDEFDSEVPTVTEEELEANEKENGENGNETSANGEDGENGGAGSSSSKSKSNKSSSIKVKGYSVYGTIRIPATGIRYSIFPSQTANALDRGIIQLYTTNGLNKPGNTVLAGHNYRNSRFFSKNKNLKTGDKVIIKDASGLQITYSIYKKFITNSQDASFYQRSTSGKREITLTTCTDRGTKTGERIIIFAKEK